MSTRRTGSTPPHIQPEPTTLMSTGSAATRATPRAARPRIQARLNPRFTFLLYIAVAIGTVPLDAALRTTILWAVLAALILAHSASRALDMRYAVASVAGGALIGLALTLPLAFLARDVLLALANSSLGTTQGILLFQRMVFIAAPLEELYFRGSVQREHGALEATIYYALSALVLYWPITQGFWLVLTTMALGSALLGGVFALVNRRFGLSAAIACHVVCNLCLFVVPTLLRDYSRLVF